VNVYRKDGMGVGAVTAWPAGLFVITPKANTATQPNNDLLREMCIVGSKESMGRIVPSGPTSFNSKAGIDEADDRR